MERGSRVVEEAIDMEHRGDDDGGDREHEIATVDVTDRRRGGGCRGI